MTVIKYWLQRADFTATDHDAVDVETAIRVLQSHDWSGEQALERERRSAGLESCPAGIGFVSESDHILHICPDTAGTALVHYHTWEPRVVVWGTPLLLGGGAVLLFALAIWFFTNGGYVIRSAAAVLGASCGFYLLRTVTRGHGLPHTSRLENEIRTRENVPIMELPGFIRRFFADDHQWLSERLRNSTGETP